MNRNRKELIHQFFEDQYPNTEMAIGYIKSGKAYFEGFLKKDSGVIEIDNSESLFEIGSITKVFTTAVLAQLILDGSVKLESLISEILPHASLKKTSINLKSLANHTSGVPRLPQNFYSIKNYDQSNPYVNYDEEALIDYLDNHLVQSLNTNSKFEYSNLGFGILGYIISKTEDLRFEEVVKDRIFTPLKMISTSFGANIKRNSVRGLNKNGEHSDYWEGGILNGCIGIISSVSDMTKFMTYILDKNNEVAKLQMSKTYKIENDHFIGLGWGIRVLQDGSLSFSHGGGSDGYSCYMKVHSESKSGVVILTNISAFTENHQSKLDELANNLRDLVRNQSTGRG